MNSFHNIVPCSLGFWKRKFGIEIDANVWALPKLVTAEVRLIVLQWKILHNIYPTNIMLCKMKVKNNKYCTDCRDQVDYIEHFFFECHVTKSFSSVYFH